MERRLFIKLLSVGVGTVILPIKYVPVLTPIPKIVPEVSTLSLAMLDELIDTVSEPTHLYMTEEIYQRLLRLGQFADNISRNKGL
jgi:hypothetical protein